jgi:serine/threonine protein kinase
LPTSAKRPCGCRDIKPQNFLLNRAWTVKVCDFGHSILSRPQRWDSNYMAPELLDGSNLTLKVDVYAFGILRQDVYD